MKSTLVTGTAGFIGSRVAQLLLDSGVEVVGIDNRNDAYDVRMKDDRLGKLTSQEGFSFYDLDIEDGDALRRVFTNHRFDAVFNLAARAGVRYSIENPQVYMTSNALGCLHILELMREFGPGKIVQASTSSLYAGQAMPFVESIPADKPLSPYAASKKAAEVMAYTFHHLYGFDVSILRFFTVYGPAGRPDMAPFRFIKWIHEGTPITVFGDGSQTRDFTYVDDIARGAILGADALDSGYEIINLGGGKKPIALLDFIGMIEDRLGKKAEIVWKEMSASEMQDTAADITKAKTLLGWEPRVDLGEGLDSTIGWYLENLDWLKDINL